MIGLLVSYLFSYIPTANDSSLEFVIYPILMFANRKYVYINWFANCNFLFVLRDGIAYS